ncbi:caspase-8-like [Bufo gargarizans]|uniref:caspase-8-like n=1 Tax=Bufo gargarizans TaxID=30331 RepID=UPI001CF453F9|nr:caspase-8-like [Bufo gargarizans]
MTDFITLLHEICSQLESSNISELTFLCKDLIPQKFCNGKQDTDLFIILYERCYIDENNTSLIEELLFYLKRYDLLQKHFNVSTNTMVERLKNPAMAKISPYRHLLYELGNLVSNSKLVEVKRNFTDILPKVTLEKVTNLWDLFIEFEKKDMIRKDNLDYLKQMSEYVEDENFKELILSYEKSKAVKKTSLQP